MKIRYRLLLRIAEIRRTRILSLRESYIAAAVRKVIRWRKENITLKEAAKYPQVMFSGRAASAASRADLRRTGHPGKTVCEAEEIEVITRPCGKWFWNIYLPTWTSSASITSPQSRCRPQAGNQNLSPEENTESAAQEEAFFSIGGNDGQEILWYSKTKSK